MPHAKGAPVKSAKTNELFDLLRAACARQFAFNPRRITASMRYVGKEGHGKEQVHVFRDAATHSQITLSSTFATLRQTHDEKAHWNDREKAHYKSSDAEIDAELAARQVRIDFTAQCRLYRDHREQLLSHFREWPGYLAGGSNPREASRLLVSTLSAANDERLAEFAAFIGSHDPEHLAHLLLAPCHQEIEAGTATAD